MATLTEILNTNNVPTNFTAAENNFTTLNTVKIESDKGTDLPTSASAVNVNKIYGINGMDFDSIVAKDPNTMYLVFDRGVYLGSVLVAPFNLSC